MNEKNRATRECLKRMSPLDAYKYIESFMLPKIHERLLYYLYVRKINDITRATYALEEDKIFISTFKATRVHKEALNWISERL